VYRIITHGVRFNKKVGRASENPNQEIIGEAQQVKGKAKQAWGTLKNSGPRRKSR